MISMMVEGLDSHAGLYLLNYYLILISLNLVMVAVLVQYCYLLHYLIVAGVCFVVVVSQQLIAAADAVAAAADVDLLQPMLRMMIL